MPYSVTSQGSWYVLRLDVRMLEDFGTVLANCYMWFIIASMTLKLNLKYVNVRYSSHPMRVMRNKYLTTHPQVPMIHKITPNTFVQLCTMSASMPAALILVLCKLTNSNRHDSVLEEYEVPVRHPDLCFEDGNLSVVTGKQYFIVHQGLLCRHSAVLGKVIGSLKVQDARFLEGRMVLSLQESPEDFAYFLRALYGFCFSLNGNTFAVVSALLRLSTKYGVDTLRKEALHGLALSWPSTLLLWELREKNATNSDGLYAPRPALPHPILVIKLAREANAPELLPSAFYDLSRYLPSQLASGYTASDGAVHHLPMEDLFRVLRGKEHAARFLSTFIVNELEGRTPSQWCLNRNELEHARKHACQIAFEAINFELIRDVNGMVCNRNTDPLFCIADSFLMQTREDLPGVENKAVHRACEACRMDYGAVVDAVREDFWRKIPEWFELKMKD